MSTAVMTARMGETSPHTRARIAGVVYVPFFATAITGAIIAPGISGPGANSDAAATANNMVAHESLYRLGWVLTLISTGCYVALMVLFYQLFKPVSRTFALLAAVFGLIGSAVTAVGSLFQIAPLVVLKESPDSTVFSAKQLQALGAMFLNLNLEVGYIALFFFGVFQLALGYLIFRSTFLPPLLGVLIALAEASLMLWLIVMGVNSQRWIEQAT